MRLLEHLAAAIVSAVLYGLSFPPAPHRGLAWIALVPFLLVLRRVSTARALLLAWVWTLALGCTVNLWFPRVVSGYFGQPYPVGFALFLGVITFTGAVQYMAFALVCRRLLARPSVSTPFLVAAAWVSAEMLRLLAFGGDPWALLGYSQVGILPLMQVADITGVHGITFVVASVNATLAEVWLAVRDERAPRMVAKAVALTSLLVGAVLGYGALRLRTPIVAAGAAVRVGVVQAHLPIGSQWKREFYGRNLDTYLRLSREVLLGSAPRLLVWPESAMTFFVDDDPSYRQAIASVLEPFGAELIAGGPSASPGGEPPYRNAAFFLGPDGHVRGRYDKQMLLPFAEYFPFGQVDILRRRFGRVREFVPGGVPQLFDTAAGRVGVVICNEGFFQEPAAARVRAGATMLVNLANDSWLGEPNYSEPAFDMVRLRAVEQRRWIVRSSTSGPSALVDPYGGVVEGTGLLVSATLAGDVVPIDVLTPYCRIGDMLAWSCVGVTLLACLAPRRPAAIGLRAPAATAPRNTA